MKDSRFDANKRSQNIAQGSYVKNDDRKSDGKPANYIRMVVLDVISDPHIIDDTKIAYWEHALKVKNIRFAQVLPRNTIIGQRVLEGTAAASDPPMFLFPFFPSHLALPCKAGEHVWVVFEHPDAQFTEMGYWMCRITEPHITDDVNHTHSARQFDPSFVPSTKNSFTGNTTPTYEFRNGIVDIAAGERYVIGGTAFVDGSETVYEELLEKTDAAKMERHEAVPRIRKRPGDLVIEGSNNASIVVGTDRKDQLTKYSTDGDRGQVPEPTDDIQKSAGSVDIVAGRGQTLDTGGVRVTSKKLNGAAFKEELGKSKAETSAHEGDPDFKNDRSRVLVSQKTKVDKNFGLTDFNGEFEIEDDGQGSGAIVIKSDKLRLIARSDITILVRGIASRDQDGNMIEENDTSKWAAMILKSNGDIVFRPAEQGVLKLGGEDANLAVLCQPAITGNGDGTGQVTAPPVLDTMLASQGGDPPGSKTGINGQFATKILLK